ncbi:hypothetical protein, partial [Methanococcus maripaludis]|uniref:hypothetical protein n=1 Tax=Methanococcus maripaludis TaxID=39152 RepID=UPI0016135C7A
TVTPETVTPETVTPETVTPETVTPETVTPETVTPETVIGFSKKEKLIKKIKSPKVNTKEVLLKLIEEEPIVLEYLIKYFGDDDE